MTRQGAALFIDPIHPRYEGDRLFDLAAGAGAGDDINAPWIHVRERLSAGGVAVHTADLLQRREVEPAAQNVYVSFGPLHRVGELVAKHGVAPSGFFALECPIVEPKLYLALEDASRVFDTMFSFTDGPSLRPFVTAPLEFEQFHLPNAYGRVHEDVWGRRDRGFLVMINANKLPRIHVRELYSERLLAVEYFNRRGEIDLYGVGWDVPPYQMGASRVPATVERMKRAAKIRWERSHPPVDPLRVAARAAWRGAVPSKADVLSRYTFAICFENMVLERWITEKIFDCFFAGTIPVYLGAPDITRWVPEQCFIDMRRFNGYPELRAYLDDLSPSEIEGFREAARDYLASDAFVPFSKEAFGDVLAGVVHRATGVAA
jgi:alpha(1,3/1,4) fucosyltransferase